MPLTSPIKRLNTIPTQWYWPPSPLSGYKADKDRGGFHVQALEDAWADRFGVEHAIACNSATSGLLAACAVCGPEYRELDIAVPCFTMSATAAAAKIAMPRNDLYFMDCDFETYCSTPPHCPKTHIGLILVTDLFGQAAPLTQWRELANRLGVYLIEDAAQSPFALTVDGKLAGTVGDIGVFSLNVHKHLQCGEGGVIVTNNDALAEDLRSYVNHGECRGYKQIGLNLRMTEFCAQVALGQLFKADELISSRVALAHELSDMVKDFWAPPIEEGKHVFYIWATKTTNRNKVVPFLQGEGIPVRAGYVEPLYRLRAFQDWESPCPVAERTHDHELMIFDICSWDPTGVQLREMREIFKRASEFSNVDVDINAVSP